MRLLFGILLILLMTTGCAKVSLSPQERYEREAVELRAWLRGPMMGTCSGLPGPESRRACILVFDGVLAGLRGEQLTHNDQFRIELAKAKAFDEVRQLWTRAEQETWLRGPKTSACQQAPFPAYAQRCLESVQKELDGFNHADDVGVDPPEVRAERAVARIEAREQEHAIERQRAHEVELARQQAAGQALLGLGISGGFMRPLPPQPTYQPAPLVPMTPAYQAPLSRPPVNCTSNRVGDYTYTNCN